MSENYTTATVIILSIFLLGCVQQSSSGGQIITLSEVATHASPTDCWIVLQGNVYNITPLLLRSFRIPLFLCWVKHAEPTLQPHSKDAVLQGWEETKIGST